MLSECCLWRQHSNNFGCELQTYPRLSTKVFSCKCCVVWVLFECCLWRQHSDNFGRELQTYPRFSTKKKFLANVVWMLSLETTLRQHSGKRSVFRLFCLFFFQTSYFFALVCPNVVCETTFTQKITNVFWVAPNWSQRILKENIFWGRNALSNTIYTTLDADATWTCFRIVFKSSLCSVPIVSGSNFSADILLGTVGLLPKGSDYCILNGS